MANKQWYKSTISMRIKKLRNIQAVAGTFKKTGL